MPITISPIDAAEVFASGLIAELDADLLSRYPGEPVSGVNPEEFRAGGGYFVLARHGSQVAGCGAFQPYDTQTPEIKRMYVRPGSRGLGVARGVLQAERQRPAAASTPAASWRPDSG